MNIIIIVAFLTFLGYMIYQLAKQGGYEDGKDAWRDYWICRGKHPSLHETGWDTRSIYFGRGRYHCPKCRSSFTEDKKRIPRMIEDILFLKESAESKYLPDIV